MENEYLSEDANALLAARKAYVAVAYSAAAACGSVLPIASGPGLVGNLAVAVAVAAAAVAAAAVSTAPRTSVAALLQRWQQPDDLAPKYVGEGK
jgi:hypothetical protein